jgi:hypothetical protein
MVGWLVGWLVIRSLQKEMFCVIGEFRTDTFYYIKTLIGLWQQFLQTKLLFPSPASPFRNWQ